MDKIANGQEDDSWIGQLYNQFSSAFSMDGAKIDESDLGQDQDGLEPPILDETWFLNSDPSSQEPRHRSKRSDEDSDTSDNADNDKEEEDDFITKNLQGEAKCKARFWKCIGGVAQSSLHYMDEPGGVSG